MAWPGGDLAERRAPCPELRRTWETIAAQRLREASGGSGLAGWVFRHRELTFGRAVREWKRACAQRLAGAPAAAAAATGVT